MIVSDVKPSATFETSPHMPSKAFAHARAKRQEIETLMALHHYHGHFTTHSGFDVESFLRGDRDIKQIIYILFPAREVSDTFRSELANILAPYNVNIILARDAASPRISWAGVQGAAAVEGGPSQATALLRKIEERDAMRKTVSSPR